MFSEFLFLWRRRVTAHFDYSRHVAQTLFQNTLSVIHKDAFCREVGGGGRHREHVRLASPRDSNLRKTRRTRAGKRVYLFSRTEEKDGERARAKDRKR